MIKAKKLALTLTSLLALMSPSVVVADQSNEENVEIAVEKSHKRTLVRRMISIPATGFNRLFGRPVMKLGEFRYLGFETVAKYNPDDYEPLPLSYANARKSTQLATYVDPEFLSNFMGGDSGTMLDSSHVNLPLREAVVNFLPTGIGYSTAPPVAEVDPEILFQGAQSLPATPILLKDWLKARGRMTLRCDADGKSTVSMRFRGLLPRRIYTVWAFFLTENTPLPFPDFGPIRPLGGVSNALVADPKGRATFKRVLNFCPMRLKGDEVPLGSVFVYYHSDQAVYGAVMSHPGEGRFPGAAGHVQLQFPVSARRLW